MSGNESSSKSGVRVMFTDANRVDLDGDRTPDGIYYGFATNDGKPGSVAGTAPLYDLNVPGKLLALVPDPRPRNQPPPSKRALIEYIGSSFKIDIEAVYRRWKKIERGVWLLLIAVAIWITTIICAVWWPNRSAALLKEMITTPARDMLDDRIVERAVEVIEEDTGEKVKPLD